MFVHGHVPSFASIRKTVAGATYHARATVLRSMLRHRATAASYSTYARHHCNAMPSKADCALTPYTTQGIDFKMRNL